MVFCFIFLIGNSFTVLGPGITMHGNEGVSVSSKPMVNRLDSKGRFAGHPKEIGLLHESEYFQEGAIYLKDCYDKHAGMIFAGPKVNLGRYFMTGIIAGVLVREHFKSHAFTTTVKGVDLTPMAMISVSAEVPVYGRFSIVLNAISNFFLNHANVGVRVR